MHRRIFIVMIMVVASSGLSHADAGSQETDVSELLQPVRAMHNAQANTGFVFAATIAGKKVIEDFAGLAVVEHNIPITPASRFPIMSITKAFTGAALSRAVTLGLVDLDTPVSVYLPDYAGEGGDEITLRMLAAHVAGIPHTGHPNRRALYVQNFPNALAAVGVFEDTPLASEPGTTYQYSSSGYNLIAAVLESVSGQSFEDFVQQEVLAPLRLDDTGFVDVQQPNSGLVRNYSYIDLWNYQPLDALAEVPTWDFSYNRGGGNMYATVDDLLRFGNALLATGHFSIDELSAMQHPVLGDTSLSRWGSGWITGEDEEGRRIVYITGATPGVQASLYVYPDDGLVFAMLANCWGRDSAGGALVIDAPQQVVSQLLGSTGKDIQAR